MDDEPGTVRRTVEEGERARAPQHGDLRQTEGIGVPRARRSTRCTGVSSVLPVVPSPAMSCLGYADAVLERGTSAAAKERG